MAAGINISFIITVFLIAFVPSIVYAILIRYVEKYDREPWGSIWIAFMWGATIAAIIVILVRGFYIVEIPNAYPDIVSNSVLYTLYGEVLIVPFAAELSKGIGLFYVKEDMEEAEDGLIYGAAIGLGYAATKNLIYGLSVGTLYGMEEYFNRIVISSLTVVLANAAITAIVGYGISRVIARKHTTRHHFLSAVPFFFAAVGMHILFNVVANFGHLLFPGEADIFVITSLTIVVAAVYSIIVMSVIYVKIWKLDRLDENAWKPSDRGGGSEKRQANSRPSPPRESTRNHTSSGGGERSPSSRASSRSSSGHRYSRSEPPGSSPSRRPRSKSPSDEDSGSEWIVGSDEDEVDEWMDF